MKSRPEAALSLLDGTLPGINQIELSRSLVVSHDGGSTEFKMAEAAHVNWQPSGLITLLTDFGWQDPFVGVMKGAIYRRFPDAKIVDLTHGILPHWPAEGAFWLSHSADYFAPGTVHVAVVDPGVGTNRRLLMLRLRGQLFLAPDNGLLAPLVESAGVKPELWEIHPAQLPGLLLGPVSATFHGRDLFAPLAAALASGGLRPEDCGELTLDYVPSWIEQPSIERNKISGVVVTIDHFGNLITNISGGSLREMTDPHVHVGGHQLPLRRTYGDVQPGEDLALINSFDVLEIARAQGSAATSLGLERGAPVIVQDSVRRR